MGSWCFTGVTGRRAALEKDNANMCPHKHDARCERSTSKRVFPYFFFVNPHCMSNYFADLCFVLNRGHITILLFFLSVELGRRRGWALFFLAMQRNGCNQSSSVSSNIPVGRQMIQDWFGNNSRLIQTTRFGGEQSCHCFNFIWINVILPVCPHVYSIHLHVCYLIFTLFIEAIIT